MNRRLAVSVLLAALIAASPAAQGAGDPDRPGGAPPQTAAPPPQAAAPSSQAPQQPTFRTRIDSVSVDVAVLDKQGNPVADLTPGDFEVREDGKLQTVDTLRFIDIDTAARSRPTTHREITSMEDQIREASRDDTRVIVIFLDDYHVRLGNGMRVREQVARFVSGLEDNDLVAVMYPLTPASAMTFSRDHDGLARAILKFQGRKYDYTPRNSYEERFQTLPARQQERMRNDIVISSLESVCAYLGTLREGRKTVLYVSEGLSGSLPEGVTTQGEWGVPTGRQTGGQVQNTLMDDRMAFFNSTELLSSMRLVFSAANRANTSIYTLDPRGLAASEFDINDNVSSEVDRRVLGETLDSLRSLAGETDGRAIVSRNDPAPMLEQMVRDSSSYYLLGYTSSEAPRDGKFHKIEVKVKRKDVDVRARSGYWAYTAEEVERVLAPSTPEPPRDVIEALESLAAADESTLRRRAMQVWLGTLPSADGPKVVLAWEGMAPEGRDAEVIDHVEVAATSAAGDALYTGAVPRTDVLGRQAGRIDFAAPAGQIRVRLTARDAAGGRVEADDVTYEVPAVAGDALFLTPPVVYKGRTARDILNIKAAEAPVPAVTRAFSRTERLLLRFGAGAPGGATPDVTLRLLNRQGTGMVDLRPPTALGDGRYEAQVVLSSVPPGDYLIEFAASAGGQSTRTLLALRITG
ncbi:MAG: VWA domain-containing protein [Vicinamibacterales bacterium]